MSEEANEKRQQRGVGKGWSYFTIFTLTIKSYWQWNSKPKVPHWSCVTPGWSLTCRWTCMWCYHGNVLCCSSNLWTFHAPWLVFHAQLRRRESFFKDSSWSFSWLRWRISKFSWCIWSRLSWRFVGISKRGHVGGLFDVVALCIKHIFLLLSWRRVLPVNTSAWLPCTQRLRTSIYFRLWKSFFCLLRLLRCFIFSSTGVSLFRSLVSMCLAVKHLSSSRSFIVSSQFRFNTYAVFSHLWLFVYFHSPSLFLPPRLPGRIFYTLLCCTQGEHACCLRPKFPYSFIHAGCFYVP